MHDIKLLTDILVIVGLVLGIILLAHQLRFPSIIGFLISGIVIGPHALGWVEDSETVEWLAETGIILLLFSIGLEFSLGKLIKIKRLLLIAGGGQVVLTILVTWGLGAMFGLSTPRALLVGCLLALSSTAVVLKILGDSRQLDSATGRLSLTILLFQDLSIVPMMLLIPYLGVHGDVDWMEIGSTLALSVTGIVLIVFGARILMPKVLDAVFKFQNRELFLITILFVAFGTAWLAFSMGISLALGAFIAGLIISESEYSHQIVADVMPVKDLMIALFFVSVGMLVDIAFLRENYLLLLLSATAIVTFKTFLIFVFLYFLKYPARLGIAAGLTVSQIGEFSFIIAMTGTEMGLLTPYENQIFLSSSIITMIVSPFLIARSSAIGQWFQKALHLPDVLSLPLQRLRVVLTAEATEKKEGGKLKGHVIIVGYGATGEYLANVLKNTGVPYLICEFLYDRFQAARKKHKHVVFGDASTMAIMEVLNLRQARLVVVAVRHREEIERIVRQAKTMNPKLYVIAHTETIADVEDMYKLGASYVVPGELETTIEMLALVLRQYHIPRNVIASQVAIIRQDKYRPLVGDNVSASTLEQLPFILSATTTEAGMILENSPCAGKTLKESGLHDTRVHLLAVVRDGKPIQNPDDDFIFQKGDLLILIGNHADIDAALGVLGCEIIS